MAPSPNDPGGAAPALTPPDGPEPSGPRDPRELTAAPDDGVLAELRRAVAAPAEPWPARLRSEVEALRARAIALPDRRATLVTVVVVAVVAVTAFMAWRGGVGLPGTDPASDAAASLPRATTTPTSAGSASAAGSSPAIGPAGDLIVQAAGAVVRPGVYHLAVGARVGDLISQAGGFAADADADRVNLASPLGDGVRVWVPRRGELDPPVPIGGGGSTRGSATGATGAPALVDLNTATADELEALPGVGPATAAAIIDHRQRNGPFRTVDDLAEVRGIGDAKLAQLRNLVRV